MKTKLTPTPMTIKTKISIMFIAMTLKNQAQLINNIFTMVKDNILKIKMCILILNNFTISSSNNKFLKDI